MNQAPRLHLASSSPRRRQILRSLGLRFSVAAVGIDESRHTGESPDDLVLRLATEKAMAANVDPNVLVLGSDTIVVLDGQVFGKPSSEEHAVDMLGRLSGRCHQVVTGVALKTPAGIEVALSRTDVRFREIGQDEIRQYWQSGEPQDKAGAYAIQGVAAVFVENMSGSYTGVMGLPVFETAELLRNAGIEILEMQ